MKSFYMRDNDDKETVAAFDLLVPGVYDMNFCDVIRLCFFMVRCGIVIL
jgi:hypothetical protein